MYGQETKSASIGPATLSKEGAGIPEALAELTKVCEELSEIISRLDSKLEPVKLPVQPVVARDEAIKTRSPLFNVLHEHLDILHSCVQRLGLISDHLDL